MSTCTTQLLHECVGVVCQLHRTEDLFLFGHGEKNVLRADRPLKKGRSTGPFFSFLLFLWQN